MRKPLVVERDLIDARDVVLPPDDTMRKEKYRITEDGEVVRALDEFGRELPDPVPMAPPVGYRKQPSLFETVRNMVRSEALRHAVENSGAESFEDADDFVIGDDFDPTSPYESEFEGLPIAELRQKYRDGEAAEDELRRRFEAAKKPNDGDAPPAPGAPARAGAPSPPAPADGTLT